MTIHGDVHRNVAQNLIFRAVTPFVPLTGSCRCEQVRFRMESAPIVTQCCHCRLYQKASGSAFRINAMIESDRLTILKGKLWSFQGASSQKVLQCPACRFSLWSHHPKLGDAIAFVGVGTPVSGEVVGTTIQEQTAQCLRNVAAILDAGGRSLAKVVSATFILAEEADFTGVNEEWLKCFAVNPPARQGAKLPIRPKGMKVAVAVFAEA